MKRQLTPCMRDPLAYDVDHPRGRPRLGETTRERMARITAPLIQACRTQCPILAQCAADPDAQHAYGVVAGEYRPWPGDAVLLQISYESAKGRVMAGLIERLKTLSPGDRLPGSTELAAFYSVARNTVNAALRELEADGLITRPREGRRSWVVAPDPAPPAELATETAA